MRPWSLRCDSVKICVMKPTVHGWVHPCRYLGLRPLNRLGQTPARSGNCSSQKGRQDVGPCTWFI